MLVVAFKVKKNDTESILAEQISRVALPINTPNSTMPEMTHYFEPCTQLLDMMIKMDSVPILII